MPSTFENFLPIGLFTIVAVLFVAFTFLGSRFFSPFRPSPKKESTYEAGEIPIGEAQIQFNFQYYVFALIFVIFDVLSVFLLIWGVAFTSLPAIAKIEMTVFIGLLLVALSYALRKERLIKI